MARAAPRIALRVPSFVVIGGGEVGAKTVRQLLRSRAAGALVTDAIFVVDRNPASPAFAGGAPVVPVIADWSEWLGAHLATWDPDGHLVPYHWAPHLMERWLAAEVDRAGGRAERGGTLVARDLPFERTTAAGDRALSYASWPCPPLCIEPALCPHTRGARDWSLATDLQRLSPGDPADESVVLRCVHLTYGVGTIPIRDIQAARERVVAAAAGARPRAFAVSTASHCHGLAATLQVTPLTV